MTLNLTMPPAMPTLPDGSFSLVNAMILSPLTAMNTAVARHDEATSGYMSGTHPLEALAVTGLARDLAADRLRGLLYLLTGDEIIDAPLFRDELNRAITAAHAWGIQPGVGNEYAVLASDRDASSLKVVPANSVPGDCVLGTLARNLIVSREDAARLHVAYLRWAAYTR